MIALTVRLAAASLPVEVVSVESYEEASRVLCAWRDAHGLASSDFSRSCGSVCSARTGKCLAVISYNGRVWPTGQKRAVTEQRLRRALGAALGPAPADLVTLVQKAVRL